ncbi:MAG: cation:proton antiporter [Candidatus Kariarchaeaceae archaeon]|jgi:Kef-type K+ transport system membrane component KefB
MAESTFLFAFLLLAIFVVIVEVAQYVSQKLNIPAVIGEITAGLIIGPSLLNMVSLKESGKTLFENFGISHGEVVSATSAIEFLAQLAALFLLFEVGLEVNFELLRRVGKESISTAIGGIVVPFAAGGLFVWLFQSEFKSGDFNIWDVGLFLGATLTATSIGISIRVLIDMGRIDTKTTRILIGAAIIDDIIALLLFSLVLGYAEEEQATSNASELTLEAVQILIGIAAFFIIVVLINSQFQKHQVEKLKNHPDKYRLLSTTLFLLFFLSWLAGVLYLAPIIGAFMAGIIIGRDDDLSESAQIQVTPIARWLVPFFFLAVGLRIDLGAATDLTTIFLAIVLSVFAIGSKIVGSGLGAYLHDKNVKDAIEIGVGMSPRGEVILIIATAALDLGVFDPSLFTMIVITVLISAVLAPLALRYLIALGEGEKEEVSTSLVS